jgi:HK97 family phage prohead protease
MDRAYALLTVKSLDVERRTFSGIASTPELDRQGEIVDLAGVTFTNPLPLLLHHDQQRPIGSVTLTKTAHGITFVAQLPHVTDPGRLKDRVDEAWHSVKSRVITGVSIGFRLMDNAIERLATGGRRLLKTEIFELSLVTIPSNASATILLVKHLAQNGSGTSVFPLAAPKEALPMTPPTTPPLRLSDVTKAQVIDQQSIDFMKYLSTVAECRGATVAAANLYLQRFPESFSSSTMRKMLESGSDWATKAATAPGTTTDATWAKPLVGVQQIANGFLTVAHGQSLLGRLGLELIPANAKIPFQTGDANFQWIAENSLTPTSKISFSDGITLPPTKIVGIVVMSAELVKLSAPGTARAMRNAMAGGLNAFVDKQFIDPTVAAVAGKNPASVTSGVTPLVGTADVVASVKALIAAFFTASPGSENPVLIANGAYGAAIKGQVPGFGLDVYISEAAGTNIIILDPKRTFYSDAGLEVDYSEHAALEMDSAPVGTAAAVVTSLWQQNLVGYRMTRFVSWGKAPNAVAYSTMP